MHELAIAQNIYKIVRKKLIDENIKVYKIKLKVGKLTAVVPDALKFCFEFVVRGTQCEGAVLDIDEVPVRAICKNCNSSFIIDEPYFICPNCSSHNIELLTGRELFIESIEVGGLNENKSVRKNT